VSPLRLEYLRKSARALLPAGQETAYRAANQAIYPAWPNALRPILQGNWLHIAGLAGKHNVTRLTILLYHDGKAYEAELLNRVDFE